MLIVESYYALDGLGFFESSQIPFFCRGNMSDLAWAVKNGDMDQVKELVEGKVES